jgi:pseudaminic acid biosynthesis-associated methylase
MTYKTAQEEFWASEFGTNYIQRNDNRRLLELKTNLFSRCIKNAPGIKSAIELGCNIGLNLVALKRINAEFELCGYEINSTAAERAKEMNVANVVAASVTEPISLSRSYDLAFTCGVLIHINPDRLRVVYENLFNLSNKYILVCEYYNPSPVSINYRGHNDKLFKRDFAGELIDTYNLELLDYGFVYHRDNYFPQDDISWFLLHKKSSL